METKIGPPQSVRLSEWLGRIRDMADYLKFVLVYTAYQKVATLETVLDRHERCYLYVQLSAVHTSVELPFTETKLPTPAGDRL